MTSARQMAELRAFLPHEIGHRFGAKLDQVEHDVRKIWMPREDSNLD